MLALRQRQAKNLIALLLLADGTPMLRAGDEFLQTQGGNNNPYNQDNETSWLDWRKREKHGDFFRFVQRMIAFRKRHPSLGRSRSWREDAHWFGVSGVKGPLCESRTVALFLRGASQADDDLYLMINSGPESVPFEIQDLSDVAWQRAIDTARQAPEDIAEAEEALAKVEGSYSVSGRSLVVLLRRRQAVGEH